MRLAPKPMKIAMFTDIHFGKKNNSILHNQDCLDFVNWFCQTVRDQGDITHIAFLGDWFENRNAVNVMTMNVAHQALKILDELGLPIFFIVGNHDLYHRGNRSVFSTKIFEEFKNVVTVSDPMVIDDTLLVAPYLFKDEYSDLVKYNHIPYWMGHFEFRNFVVTGTDRKMEHGPDHSAFAGPIHIFSGHFHKRQARDNVVYIGNTFPMDYGDAWDDARGMAILETISGNVDFIDWKECPKYRKVKLSDVLGDGSLVFPPKCRVRCIVDVDIGYSEAQGLREELVKQLALREFSLEENLTEKKDALAGEGLEDLDLSSLNDAVIKMIKSGISGTTTIDPNKLVEIYQQL